MPIKILLADDSLTIQKVVELTFSDAETRLMAVGSGDRAVQALDDFQPDIVLADVVMPGLTGYDVCEAVKQRPGGAFVPVVLLTGTFEPFDRARAEKVGSDAIVTKPFDSHALQGLVRELVERSRTARVEAASAPPPVLEPPPTVILSAEDLEPPPSSRPIDTASTLVLTPLDLEAAAPPPFADAAAAAPEGESIYSTMAMKVPTSEELAAAEAPAPFELAEDSPASEQPSPFEADAEVEPPPPAFLERETAEPTPSPFEDETASSTPLATPGVERPAFEPEPVPFEQLSEAEVPPPPVAEPFFAYEPPPPPPPAAAYMPPPPPPPPAFYEVEAPAPPPPPPYRESPVASPDPYDVASLDTAPVTAFVAEPAPEVEPFATAGAVEAAAAAEVPAEPPFEMDAEASTGAAAEDVEIEIEPDSEPAQIGGGPSGEPELEPFVAPSAAPLEAEAPASGAGETVEAFPEMEATAPAEEPAPWDEGPAPEIPPPPSLSAGPEEHPEGTEPITRDLDADMEAFEASGRVRRRPEIWERHAALIGEEVPTDIDVPGSTSAEEATTAAEEPFPSELEEIAAAARLEDLSMLIPAGAPAAPEEGPAPESAVAAVTTAPISGAPVGSALSDADVDRIARRMVQLLSDKAVRDIAWEVVPEYAERLVRERIAEVERAG